ncbi:unnamed protein product [Anisakis simplex]|uniref:Major facilitator superfamily (MFS) profile domain-containing protein n=1 Tax=Anisakis simplex TaxID=6269 RepID=A0A3P6SM88_ANISI|nr:unnamed protein product [Anisakis simplex]
MYEGDIVCPHTNLPQHLQTIQAIGSAVGALLAGHIADYYGRKWVTYSGAVQMTVFGFMGALSVNWQMLAFAMLGMGFSYGVLIDASMTLACETVGRRYRIVQTLAFQWSLALQVSSLCAYLTGEWRRYLLVMNASSLPVLALMLFWLESPRWLIQKKRYTEAAFNINRISYYNRSQETFSPNDLVHIKVHDGDRRMFLSIGALISTPNLTAYSFVMFMSALTVEMCVAVILFDVQAKLYPTVIRAMAVGVFGVVERIGGGLAPQLITVNHLVWSQAAVTVTTVVVFISLLSGYMILPETRNASMPDLIESASEKSCSTTNKTHSEQHSMKTFVK